MSIKHNKIKLVEMPTKEEVKKAYKRTKQLIKAIEDNTNIPQHIKDEIIDAQLDRLIEIQKYLFDYLDEEDFNDNV